MTKGKIPTAVGKNPQRSPLDYSNLSDSKKEELKAKAQELVNAELSKKAEDAYLLQAMSEARGEFDKAQNVFMDQPVEIRVELAPNCANEFNTGYITIDGQRYENGRTYTVSLGKAEAIQYAMFKTWDHEFIVKGEKKEYMQAVAPKFLSAGKVNTTTSLRS